MWWREKVGTHSRYQVWDVCGQLNLSSTDFYTRLSSQARSWGMTFSMLPCPRGSSLDCANERLWCQTCKVEATHHISPVAAAAVCRCEVDSGFQASSCKSASSARQAAELNGTQVSLKRLTLKISWKSAAVLHNLDSPSLWVQCYVCF